MRMAPERAPAALMPESKVGARSGRADLHDSGLTRRGTGLTKRKISRAIFPASAIIALFIGVIALGAHATSFDLKPLLAMNWLARDAQFRALSQEPSPCPAPGRDHGRALDDIRAGQILFSSPFILGGEAARSGLSCAVCHSAGSRNADFQMRGVSAEPGTADVTNSLFSHSRGNGTFDPVAIPDLRNPGKVSRDPRDRTLEAFLRQLIEAEFSGTSPSEAQISALAAYVRAQTAPNCQSGDQVPIRLAPFLSFVDDAMFLADAGRSGAVTSASTGYSIADRIQFANAARHALQQIDERFYGPQLASYRARLRASSQRISVWITALRAGAERDNQVRIDQAARFFWRGWAKDKRILLRAEGKSLFAPALLQRMLTDQAAQNIDAPTTSER